MWKITPISSPQLWNFRKLSPPALAPEVSWLPLASLTLSIPIILETYIFQYWMCLCLKNREWLVIWLNPEWYCLFTDLPEVWDEGWQSHNWVSTDARKGPAASFWQSLNVSHILLHPQWMHLVLSDTLSISCFTWLLEWKEMTCPNQSRDHRNKSGLLQELLLKYMRSELEGSQWP